MKAIEHVGLERTEVAAHRNHVVHPELLFPNRQHVVLDERGFERCQCSRVQLRVSEIDAGGLRAKDRVQWFDFQPFWFRAHLIKSKQGEKNCVPNEPKLAKARRPPLAPFLPDGPFLDRSPFGGVGKKRCI